MNALGTIGFGDAMRFFAPDEQARWMVRQFGDGFDFFQPYEEPRRTWQILWPCQVLRRVQRRCAAHGSFRQGTFYWCSAKHAFGAEPYAKRIDKLADIDVCAILADMPPNRLPLNQCFRPTRR